MKNQVEHRSKTEAAGHIAGICVGAGRHAMRGKHLSAAIIVLAGAMLLLGGSYIAHSDTKLFVQFVGTVICVVGLGGWIFSVAEK